MSVIGKQADGNPMVVIHNFDTRQRYTIPLPIAPYDQYLLMRWSPDGSYGGVSLFYRRRVTFEDVVHLPQHTWTGESRGLLYYDYNDNWEAYGSTGELFLIDTQQHITLPSLLVNDPLWSGDAWRGLQVALIWNEIDTQTQSNAVKVGVLTVAYTFYNAWIYRDDPVAIHWLSDTRLAVTTSAGFAWGNIAGSD